MKTSTKLAAIAALGLAVLAGPAATSAQACNATVVGLSGTYNLRTGSGFLAIRAQPTTRSRMVGQTFNGNPLDIRRSSGRWHFAYDYNSGKRGWVYGRYVSWGC